MHLFLVFLKHDEMRTKPQHKINIILYIAVYSSPVYLNCESCKAAVIHNKVETNGSVMRLSRVTVDPPPALQSTRRHTAIRVLIKTHFTAFNSLVFVLVSARF